MEPQPHLDDDTLAAYVDGRLAHAELGRAFDREAYFDGADSVVILSAKLWRTEFGGDPAIVGRTIELASGRARVLGVLAPDEFTLPVSGTDIWSPLHVPTTGPNAWMGSRATLTVWWRRAT